MRLAFEQEVSRVSRILRCLNFPVNEFFINGSGVLRMHGIDNGRPMGDLDIFCTTALWIELLQKRVHPAVGNFDWEVVVPPRFDPKRRCDPAILRTTYEGLTVDVFCDWRRRGGLGDFDVNFYMTNAEIVRGWPCVPLQFIMDWKLGYGRNKDLTDVIAIRRHLRIDGVVPD